MSYIYIDKYLRCWTHANMILSRFNTIFDIEIIMFFGINFMLTSLYLISMKRLI